MRLSLHSLLHRLPPGPGRFPWVDPRWGLRMRQNTLGELMRFYDEFGPVFTLRMPGLGMVFLIGPEANQRILVNHPRDFTWADGFFGDLIPFIGQGLLTTDDDTHDRARRLLMPSFKMSAIRNYADRMVAIAARAAERLPVGQKVELHGFARVLALRVATRLLFGMSPDHARSTSVEHELAHHFESGLRFYGGAFISTLVLRGPGTPYRNMLTHVRKLEEIVTSEIRRRRRTRRSGDDRSILETLLEASDDGDRLDDTEIRDHMLTLLFAGHDTTAATVAWAVVLLGQHPHAYRRLQAELRDELGDRDPTGADLIEGLPFLDRVVKETLRKYPPAWFGPRRARKSFEIHGHHIPAGTQVSYCSWATHHLPELWGNPDAFDPDRFLPERAASLPPGAYIPFGRGPRICLGMRFGELEVKAILATMLRRRHLELFPGQDFRARTIPTISPRDGVLVMVGDTVTDPRLH